MSWLWALAVCLCFLGWGGALARLCGLPRDAGSAGCLGVAFAVCCGGVLDLLGVVGPVVCVGFVLAGAVLALPAARWPRLPDGRIARLLLAAVLLLGAVAVVGHVYYPEFNRFDDYSAYMAFPEKMLRTGSLGFEPFSERRLLTSLGGLYFLHALVLPGAGIFYLHVVDPAFGFFLLLLLLDAAMRGQQVAPARRFSVLLFALLLAPPIVNLTAILLPLALMIYAYRLLAEDAGRGRVVALALVAAAMVAMKPAYLPWVGSFFALVYGRRIVLARFRAGAWMEPAALAVLTVLFLLPWMLANLWETGTAMYPLFGLGYHAARYGNYPAVWTMVTPGEVARVALNDGRTLGPELLVCGLLFVLGWRRAGRREAGVVTLCFLVSSLVLVLVVAAGTALQDFVRYSYPGVAAALLAALLYMAATAAGRGLLVAVAACLVVVAGNAHGLVQYYGHAAANLAIAVAGPGLRPAMLAGVLARDNGAERLAVLRMQAAIPEGTPFLERLDYPFLLDFRRNNVLIADYPGAAGLPPGMPVFQGPEKLASYLLSVSVRYVAYAYADEAEYRRSEQAGLPGTPWVQLDWKLAYDFQDNLAALMRTRRLVFRDDERVVIDLAEPAGG